MSGSPYQRLQVNNGYVTYNMKSWDDFSNFINKHFLTESKQFIWRGQEDSTWLLESGLNRLIKKYSRIDRIAYRQKHLERFRYSIRGRCDFLSSELSDNDCWALGQHYGLATPLLDWTVSPFIAAFFAVKDIPNQYPNASYKGLEDKSFSIFALHKYSVIEKCKEMTVGDDDKVSIIEPLIDGNPRLVSQGGLFTKIPISTDVETWINDNFIGEDFEILIKFIIPYKDLKATQKVLNLLERMNINHLSLFPDLNGSSQYCNMKLAIPGY